MSSGPMLERALQAVRDLHAEVDRGASELARRHAARLRCGRGCAACCVDGITVFEIEAERIRQGHAELLEAGRPHAPGACAFLGEAGECRIYADRPYVCRTQGLPLRWIEEDAEGELGERRDICELNLEGGPPLDALDEDACWLIGPSELALRRIQEGVDAGAGRRTALRDLFGATSSED